MGASATDTRNAQLNEYDTYPIQTREAAERNLASASVANLRNGTPPTDVERAWLDGYTQALHDIISTPATDAKKESGHSDSVKTNGLRAARLAKGMKQSELADLTGIPRTRISEYESSWRPMDNMTVSSLRKLAEALDVTMEQILGN